MTKKRVLSGVVLAVAAGVAGTTNGYGFSDDFSSNPLGTGSQWVVTGPNTSALADGTSVPVFEWTPGTLTVNYNSTQPTSRLSVPIGATLTAADAFSVSAEFTIRGENYEADPNGYMGILNVALINSATTGLNRTGNLSDFAVDVFDNVEMTFWPNVAAWGGPYVAPSVFGGDNGSHDGFANFSSWFGTAAKEIALPLDTPLEMRLDYDADAKTVALTIRTVAGSVLLDAAPLDVSFLAPPFSVDALAISMYNDGWWMASSPPSAVATVDYSSISVSSGSMSQSEVEGTPAVSVLGLAALVSALAATAACRRVR
ncbi:MAG: hypothetical protein J7M12_04330 [Candidatus Hydrogenedentes bacterium]|nr:hypothetical protein [Candidatus Hydrogenedentota bacterium]